MTSKAILIDDVFDALADPTRRQILERLGESGAASASTLASEMAISRQAIAKHLYVLEDAGIVNRSRSGKKVDFAVEPNQLAATGRWLNRVAARWAQP